MKKFVSVHDVKNIDSLVDKALSFKKQPYSCQAFGKNKRIGLIFLNPSLRTRLSTQIAATNLGMEAIVLNMDKESWALEFREGAIMNSSSVEHIKDAAPILGQYFDIICIRSFPALRDREEDYAEQIINSFILHAGIPVISLESATLHPLQSLTDIITISENYTAFHIRKPKIVLTWAPHIKALPQAVSNSFAQWVNAWDKADLVIAQPEGFELKEEYTKGASLSYNQEEALQDADFVYVKNWSSYKNYGQVKENADDWLLTNDKLKMTNHAKALHCLPVRRNLELSDEVIDSANCLTTIQAGNRVWAAQAVIHEIAEAL